MTRFSQMGINSMVEAIAQIIPLGKDTDVEWIHVGSLVCRG